MKCVPVHHGIPAVLHRDEPWLHRHSENGALALLAHEIGPEKTKLSSLFPFTGHSTSYEYQYYFVQCVDSSRFHSFQAHSESILCIILMLK